MDRSGSFSWPFVVRRRKTHMKQGLQSRFLLHNMFRSTSNHRNTEVAHQDNLELTSDEFVLAHGKSTFLKADRLAKLIRENAGTGRAR